MQHTKEPWNGKNIPLTAAILLREHDNVEQAIAYAERMAQRYADSRNMMALDYQNAAKELKEWKRNKPRCTTN